MGSKPKGRKGKLLNYKGSLVLPMGSILRWPGRINTLIYRRTLVIPPIHLVSKSTGLPEWQVSSHKSNAFTSTCTWSRGSLRQPYRLPYLEIRSPRCRELTVQALGLTFAMQMSSSNHARSMPLQTSTKNFENSTVKNAKIHAKVLISILISIVMRHAHNSRPA